MPPVILTLGKRVMLLVTRHSDIKRMRHQMTCETYSNRNWKPERWVRPDCATSSRRMARCGDVLNAGVAAAALIHGAGLSLAASLTDRLKT
jgi:hypothetical protein